MDKTNFQAIRGDTFSLTLTFSTGGVPINITGWTIFFTLKNNIEDADADKVITKTVVSHTSPTTGVTTIALTAAETALLAGSYFYDVQYKQADGTTIMTCLEGILTFNKDITLRTT